jgi:hypothetical protein
MTAPPNQQSNIDRYVVIHIATTCDEHGVYVTKDSAEVIEIGWMLLDAKTKEEVRCRPPAPHDLQPISSDTCRSSYIASRCLSSRSTLQSRLYAVRHAFPHEISSLCKIF